MLLLGCTCVQQRTHTPVTSPQSGSSWSIAKRPVGKPFPGLSSTTPRLRSVYDGKDRVLEEALAQMDITVPNTLVDKVCKSPRKYSAGFVGPPRDT